LVPDDRRRGRPGARPADGCSEGQDVLDVLAGQFTGGRSYDFEQLLVDSGVPAERSVH
jgi:hypothetical protein